MKKYIIPLILVFLSCNGRQKKYDVKDQADTMSRLQLLESRANTLYDQKRYSEAINYFDSLLNIDTLKGEYYFKKAYSYGMLVQRDKAIENYKKSIHFKYKLSKSYFNIGLNYSYDNDTLALLNFEKCLLIDQKFPDVADQILDCKRRLKERKMPLKY